MALPQAIGSSALRFVGELSCDSILVRFEGCSYCECKKEDICALISDDESRSLFLRVKQSRS